MKTVTVRLPERLAAEIESESRARRISKSDVIRERLTKMRQPPSDQLESIRDLIGSVHGLPAYLGEQKKKYLRQGYGRKRHR